MLPMHSYKNHYIYAGVRDDINSLSFFFITYIIIIAEHEAYGTIIRDIITRSCSYIQRIGNNAELRPTRRLEGVGRNTNIEQVETRYQI